MLSVASQDEIIKKGFFLFVCFKDELDSCDTEVGITSPDIAIQHFIVSPCLMHIKQDLISKCMMHKITLETFVVEVCHLNNQNILFCVSKFQKLLIAQWDRIVGLAGRVGRVKFAKCFTSKNKYPYYIAQQTEILSFESNKIGCDFSRIVKDYLKCIQQRLFLQHMVLYCVGQRKLLKWWKGYPLQSQPQIILPVARNAQVQETVILTGKSPNQTSQMPYRRLKENYSFFVLISESLLSCLAQSLKSTISLCIF